MVSLRLLSHTLSNMWLLNPHVSVSRIDDIDFAKLRSVGVRYIVFDKDNTLTAHLQDNYFDSQL